MKHEYSISLIRILRDVDVSEYTHLEIIPLIRSTQLNQRFPAMFALIFASPRPIILLILSFQMNMNCVERDISVVGNNNIIHFNAHTNLSNAECRIFESSFSTDILFWIIVLLGIFVCISFCCCHGQRRTLRDRDRTTPCPDSQTLAHV